MTGRYEHPSYGCLNSCRKFITNTISCQVFFYEIVSSANGSAGGCS